MISDYYLLYSPNAPFNEKERVMSFIKYCVLTSERIGKTVSLNRKEIINNTGISPGNFAKIIRSLENENKISVRKASNRFSPSTYWLKNTH